MEREVPGQRPSRQAHRRRERPDDGTDGDAEGGQDNVRSMFPLTKPS